MSRALNLDLSETDALKACESDGIGVSTIEKLVSGGVRIVTMSSEGAETLRRTQKKKLIAGEVVRQKFRPSRGHL